MKTEKLIQRLSLFIFAMALTMSAWAQNASGNEDYLNIATKEDWKAFGDRVRSGESDLNAKLTADIDLGTGIWKIGSESTGYSGTFDGQGHTITINWSDTAGDCMALFPFVTDATIQNLHIKGQMTSDDVPLSVFSYEASGTTTFSGCISEVNITSGNTKDNSCAAGMVITAGRDARLTFNDCLVMGDITGTTANSKRGMAGFVCYQDDNATCTLTHCLYLGTNNADGGGFTFAPNPTFESCCFYLNACGEPDGIYIEEDELFTGILAWYLQDYRTDRCYWAQVLGKMPILYREADKSKTNYVYYDVANEQWACDDFRLTDGTLLPIGLNFTAARVTYDRTLSVGKATVCLPYELPIRGFKAYFLSGGNDSKVYFEEVTGMLEPYFPYLLVADGVVQLDGENIWVKAFTPEFIHMSTGNYTFNGTIHDFDFWEVDKPAYILQNDGKFHKVTGNPAAMIPPYRAFITRRNSQEAKELSIILDGETTGIHGVTDDAAGLNGGPVYDLQGRCVADRLMRRQLPAGVYIAGDRKIIVK